MTDFEELQLALKPYTLPSLKELGAGARSGIVGGLQAGALTLPMLALFVSPWWNASSDTDLSTRIVAIFFGVVGMVVSACCNGALVGLPLSFFTGVLTYFILMPWIPAERWPELGECTRRGMRLGAVLGTVPAVACFWLSRLFPMPLSGAFYRPIGMGWEIFSVLLIPLGMMAGGFFNPLCRIALPAWRERKSGEVEPFRRETSATAEDSQ